MCVVYMEVGSRGNFCLEKKKLKYFSKKLKDLHERDSFVSELHAFFTCVVVSVLIAQIVNSCRLWKIST